MNGIKNVKRGDTVSPFHVFLISGPPLAPLQVYHAVGPEKDALRLQESPLGAGSVDVEDGLCAAETVYHPVAGNGCVLTARHSVAHRPGAAGHPRQTGDLPVGGHLSRGNPADDVPEDGEDGAAHRSSTVYRSVRRAERMGSCRRTAGIRSKSRSAYKVTSSAPARQRTVPQGSTAMEFP